MKLDRTIIKLRKEGYNSSDIAKKLNSMGATTPRGKKITDGFVVAAISKINQNRRTKLPKIRKTNLETGKHQVACKSTFKTPTIKHHKEQQHDIQWLSFLELVAKRVGRSIGQGITEGLY